MKLYKKLIGLYLLIAIIYPLKAQQADTLDLFTCYKLVRQNAPQLSLFDINNKSTDINIRKAQSNNLPNVTGFAKASYQSDAVSVSLPIPGATGIEVDRFQYNAGVNVDQKLFDGGITSVQKDIIRLQGEINNLETEAGLYKLNELTTAYYFGILTMQKSIEIIQLRTSTLQERQKTIASGVKNGMILKSEMDRIESEILSGNQQITESVIAKTQMENNLKTLVGYDLGKSIALKIPDIIPVSDSINRVELDLYQANMSYADALKSMQNKRYIPHVYAYGQAGYSYPGLNMFENAPAGYYIVGAKLSWQIFDFNQAKKEKQLIDLQKERIAVSEKDFNRNLQMSINSETEEFNKVQQLIETDVKIIAAKEAITKASASALDNGTITTVDYLNDLNAELKARFDFESHKIALLKSSAKLAIIKGINVE